jgi:hypothetical protein
MCHYTSPAKIAPKPPKPVPGTKTCEELGCTYCDPLKGCAYCDPTKFTCKNCYVGKNKQPYPPITQSCKLAPAPSSNPTKEGYTSSGKIPWSPWKPGSDAPLESENASKFASFYTSVGSSWDGKNLIGVKGNKGAAMCHYGSYYDPTPTPGYEYGSCVDHTTTCPHGGKSNMGFCGDPGTGGNILYTKPGTLNNKISVFVGIGEKGADTAGYMDLLIPDITMTWYALVGWANTKEDIALDYITTVLDFCSRAGIKKLAFPFIVPDGNNTPYIYQNSAGNAAPGKEQVMNSVSWINEHVITPAIAKNVEIGLNVYASYKDARWKSWFLGNGDAACAKNICDVATSALCKPPCTWKKAAHGHPGICQRKTTENFTTNDPSWDPCPASSTSKCCQLNSMSCSWPYIAKFIKLLQIASGKKDGKENINFLQVDEEWCNCGELNDNVACVKDILNSDFEFTIATSLGTPGDVANSIVSVPEVYWDSGNQFPCTGGPGCYNYLTPACTDSTTHRRLKNNPKAFYDLIAGDDTHSGSDAFNSTTSKPNGWLGRGKFAQTVTDLLNQDPNSQPYIVPSFSIENLSMCEGKMKFTGDPKQGTARWECTQP